MLVEPDDPAALADSVIQLLRDSASNPDSAPVKLRTFDDVASEIGSFLEQTAASWPYCQNFAPRQSMAAACCLK
jgi:hypothetical protein